MAHVILVIWYTATALLGPGVCCCAGRSAATPVHHQAKAPTGKRTCCGSTEHTSRSDHSPKKDHTPADCPCKHHKAAQLPPLAGTSNGSELFGKLRAFDLNWSDWAVSAAFDRSTAPPADSLTDLPASPGKLGGRALLSACQILRC